MERELRQKDILDKAMSVFIQRGYKATTTSEIAKVAEISEVTLFRYFKSKQEIFMAGIEPFMDQSLTILRGHDEEARDDERLLKILKERVYFISQNHLVIKLILNEHAVIEDGMSILNSMVKSLNEVLEEMGIQDRSGLQLRLLMGTFLSYLYLPKTDPESMEVHLKSVVKTLLKKE